MYYASICSVFSFHDAIVKLLKRFTYIRFQRYLIKIAKITRKTKFRSASRANNMGFFSVKYNTLNMFLQDETLKTRRNVYLNVKC
jgi:hypothetical protein